MQEIQTVEAKHIFIDIVNYTYNRSVEAQSDLIVFLNKIVKKTISEKKIKPADYIFIPTGDGMCISILNINKPHDVHLIIALSILEKIEEHNFHINDDMRKFNIRIGINENIDNLIIDINNNKNISGSGINFAARIEGLGDYNQILIGNSVFEKLIHREKYMKSFRSYTTEVKHGIPITVYQYVNYTLSYLNNDIPSKFRKVPNKIPRLTSIQAYYLKNCIENEQFINDNLNGGGDKYILQLIFINLAQDLWEKSKATKTSPNVTIRIKRPLKEQFTYLKGIDFWLYCDLNTAFEKQYLKDIENCFTENYLFVSDIGKKRLQEDFPNIYTEILI